MPKSKRKSHRRLVALEVSRHQLNLAVLEHSRDGDPPRVRTRSMIWRQQANSLHGEAGIRELSAAMKTLIAKEKLAGCRVHLALSGDYSVTRVVAGGTERVRHEMRLLEERSSLYLSLGPGSKAVAGAIRQIDARHQHAWLAATNKRTLDALLNAAEVAGIEIELVEPSLIALCRAVGNMGHDLDGPVLVISVQDKGLELGLSCSGRLLLDHRPAGSLHGEGPARAVIQHLERLQRYCDRHFRHAGGKIKKVYLCGSRETVVPLAEEFRVQGELEAAILDPADLNEPWQIDLGEQDGRCLAVLGVLLGGDLPAAERNGPNLMERLRSELREPQLGRLLKTAWPLAAALLLAATLLGINRYEMRRTALIESELAQLAKEQEAVRAMQLEITAADAKAVQLRRLAAGVRKHDWQALLSYVAQCLPEDVWLDSLSVDSGGRVVLGGNSHSEDGVFEFVRWLQQVPLLERVALESTRPVQAHSGPATRFDVGCDFAGRAGDDAEG